MNERTTRYLIVGVLLLALSAMACGISNPLEKAKLAGTAVAIVPTIQAGATALLATGEAAATSLAPTLEAAATGLAPTLEAAGTQAAQLMATSMAAATEMAPTLEAAATELAPTLEAMATSLPDLTQVTPEGGVEEFLALSEAGEGLTALDSFRQTATIDFVGGNQTGKIDYAGEFTLNPQATHGLVTVSGAAAAGIPLPSFEYVVIEGEAWLKLGRQAWIPVPEGVEQITGQQPYSADNFLLALPNAQRVMPDQTVNGIECKHYRYTIQDFQYEGGTIHVASGEVFTALDGGFVVQYSMLGDATMDAFGGQRGNVSILYNVTDVNSGISIERP